MNHLPKYRTCFVCGPDNDRGLKQTFISIGDGEVSTEFNPVPDLCSYTGIVHGGIVATLLDETMGWTAFEKTNRYFLTAEMTVRYKESVLLDKKYTVRAKLGILKRGFYTATGEIVDSDGKVYATGSGKYFLTDEPNEEDTIQIIDK